MPSKKLNARKGQILFLLSGICSQVNTLAELINSYISSQARSENKEEHLTATQVFFLTRLSGSLRNGHKALTKWIKEYNFDSGLIKDSSDSNKPK